MATDEKSGWKNFRQLKFDSKRFSRRAKRAETITTRHARKFVLDRLSGIRDVRDHISRWMLLVVILIAAVAVQMLWFQKTYKTEAAVSGGTYAEGTRGPIQTLNPLYATSSAELSASKLIFSGLFTYDTTGHLNDDLANSISQDVTGKIYTVTLRPQLKWQDGERLTADDVVFTVNLMKNPATRAVMAGNWQSIKARALDDHTVQFILPSPYAAFPSALTFAVLPQHLLADIDPGTLRENTYSLSPVGSGPFKLQLLQSVSVRGNSKIAYLVPWSGYYGGQPRLHRFELHSYDSPNAIMKAFTTGDINAATDVNGASIAAPKSANIEYAPIDNGVYAIFNTSSPVLKNKTVRRALQLGTDTKALRASVAPNAPALDLPFVPGQLSGARIPGKPAYNPSQAKRLLDKAGWRVPKGGGIRQKKQRMLELNVVTINDSAYKKTLDVLKKQWRLLGVDIKTQVYDPGNIQQSFVQNVLQPRNYDVLIYELVIGADPDVYAYWHSSQANPSGYNFANYDNGISDDILASARGKSSAVLRNEKYKAFARQWLLDAPAVGLYQSAVEYVRNPQVAGLSRDMNLVTSTDRFSNILYWTADRSQVYKTP